MYQKYVLIKKRQRVRKEYRTFNLQNFMLLKLVSMLKINVKPNNTQHLKQIESEVHVALGVRVAKPFPHVTMKVEKTSKRLKFRSSVTFQY